MGKHSTAKTSEESMVIFNKIAAVVQKITGVQLGERQKAMVETRLAKRQIELGLADEFEYFEYFENNLEEETAALVSIMTTHHTYFFREYSHFEYLEKHAIKDAVEAAKARGDNKIRIWSAACSRGQEVYSIAMFLEFHLKKIAPGFGYEIVGSDVDPESVSIAQNGVYARKEIKEVPLPFLADHWAKGTGDIADFVKVKPSLKHSCKFKSVNLIKLDAEPITQKYDIIFCRNVFIYFTVDQIKLITTELLKRMQPTGVLFIGISESLHGIGLPVRAEGASIYRHGEHKKESSKVVPLPIQTKSVVKADTPKTTKNAPPATATDINKPLRVLCIDDSPSILVVLKQVLRKEHGFDVVATAANGLEATQKLKELGNNVDLVTLDIHMPHQDGMDYLQKNMSAKHPPVVMISSVSRENSSLALKCLELGAKDYVEKPALSNLNERSEEIRLKLHCAYQAGKEVSVQSIKLDKGFAKPFTIKDPDKKFRLILAGLADRKKLCQVLKELTQNQPPTLILMQGSDGALPALVADIAKVERINIELVGPTLEKLAPGKVYLGDYKKTYAQTATKYGNSPTSVLVFGLLGKDTGASLKQWKGANILIEDTGIQLKDNTSVSVATDIVPATSFAYMSGEFLSK